MKSKLKVMSFEYDSLSIMLPSKVVAEVTFLENLENNKVFKNNNSDHNFKTINWRGNNIPLIDIERFYLLDSQGQTLENICKDQDNFQIENLDKKSKIAIFNKIGESKFYDFIAIIVKKVPKWDNVMKQDIKFVEELDKGKLFLKTSLYNEESYILNLEALYNYL